jgi:hypothetical protein
MGFFIPITDFMDNLFFSNFLHMKWVSFTHQEFVQGTSLPYMTVYWPSERRTCDESFWTSCEWWSQALHFHSYTILYTTHVYSLTWLSNNLNMLRANRNFDVIQLMQTKLGTSIICIRDDKSANPCVKFIE